MRFPVWPAVQFWGESSGAGRLAVCWGHAPGPEDEADVQDGPAPVPVSWP